MKSTQILEKIKTFLGEETQEEVLVELAQAKLENGTVLEAEAFEAGKEIFIVSEDDRVAVPVGEYMMEDGRKLIVKEEGIIGEIKAKEEEPSVKEEDRTDAKLMEPKEEEEEKKEMKKYVRKEEFDSAIEEIKDMINKLQEEKEEEEEKKEEMSQKLSAAPASAPITHNPEVRSNTKVQFGTNRKETTLDRVMKKLTNN